MLSVTMNAWFYVSWTISSFVAIVPFALTTVLYATNSAQPTTLAHKARLTLGLSFVTCLLANCLFQFGSKQVLGLFGHEYAEQASLCSIKNRMGRAVLPLAFCSILELGMAALGARLGGLSGLSLGWLFAVSVEAVFLFSPVYKVVRALDTTAEMVYLRRQQ